MLIHLLIHYPLVQPVSQVVKESALLMQEYTQSGGVRPFGVSCLVAGYDNDGPQLFQVDPSGMIHLFSSSYSLTHSLLTHLQARHLDGKQQQLVKTMLMLKIS